MTSEELFSPILEIAGNLKSAEKFLTEGNPSEDEKEKLEQLIVNLTEEYNEKKKQIIYSLLSVQKIQESSEYFESFLGNEFASMKKGYHVESHGIIDEVEKELVELFNKESRKSPLRRKVEKYWILLAILAVILLALGSKSYWLVDVDTPFEEPQGVIEGTQALDKALEYFEMVDSKNFSRAARKNGWLKSFVFWPIEPTEAEYERAAEFLSSSVTAYTFLKEQGIACDNVFDAESDNGKMDISEKVAKTIKAEEGFLLETANKGVPDLPKGFVMLSKAVVLTFPCE